jgi:RAB protein geranylgeranyltransferase component A
MDAEPSNESEKLSFSRAYTLTLSPQIIYTNSKLLAQLVSSKVYRQLEFQAVGNWWIFDEQSERPLKRLPNGREDIFQDKSLDNRAKRNLMKFIKFVVDYEHQTELCEPHAKSGLAGFLSLQFQLPEKLQDVIAALTLSLNTLEDTPVGWALPRIARHLTSIGVFGPGFGAVVPKWGGGAEISQVACRAGAVGGGIYVLGTGVKSCPYIRDEDELFTATLKNDETVKTKFLIGDSVISASSAPAVSKIIAVVSSPLNSLFKSYVEGSPLAAVSVVVLPAKTIAIEGITTSHPVYIMVHSSETGECPAGQCQYPISLSVSPKHYMMIQLMNTYLHCLNSIEDNIPLTV